jgi:hypothetical protein
VDVKEILAVVKQVRDHVAGMSGLGDRRREWVTEALAGALRRVEESELLREVVVELRCRERLLLVALADYRRRHGRGYGCACCRAAEGMLGHVKAAAVHETHAGPVVYLLTLPQRPGPGAGPPP